MPSFWPPMLLASGPPRHLGGWAAQPKLDGWRAQVLVEDGAVRVWSRGGHRVRVPELDGLAELAGGRHVRLDGELVVMRGAVADWHALCHRMRRGDGRSPHRAGFLAFDLLALDGADVTQRPWSQRQALLHELSWRSDAFGVVPVLADAADAWERAQADGWEGVTFKRLGSVWRRGERSPDWRKRKVWTRGTFTVVRARTGSEPAIDVVDVDGRGCVVEHVGESLLAALTLSSAPDRRGWCSVAPAVAVTVQHRVGPAGELREPRLVADALP